MKILLTGGTGSFGREFIKTVISKKLPLELLVYSRDEMKQWELMSELAVGNNIRFVQGDVRDLERLIQVSKEVDTILHAAATKIVPMAEVNPEECIKTNVLGALNIVTVSQRLPNIKRVVALSTDKASSPVNLYGASKLISDKLILNANNRIHGLNTSIVRYGNVINSRGSVIPFFKKQYEAGKRLTITDPQMTRFLITLEDAVELVMLALYEETGGGVLVKKIPSIKLVDIARAISPDRDFDVIGIRPGEKLHEEMISNDEARLTMDFGSHFKITPNQFPLPDQFGFPRLVPPSFSYRSDNNDHFLSPQDLNTLLSRLEHR